MKRFSKAISLALLVFTMIFALASCSTAPKQDLGDIVVAEVPVAEPAQEVAPAEEAPAAEPVVEPAQEVAPAEEAPVAEPVVETVTYVPVEKKYTLFGYELTVVADKGKATITYPASIITEADIDAAAMAAFNAFSSVYDLSNVYYEAKDGVLTVTYPEAWGVEELAIAEKVVMEQLPAYVESVVASYLASAEEVVEEPVVEEAEDDVLAASISLFGYEASITYEDGLVTIDYPDFITVAEVRAAAEAAYAAYSQYLEGSELVIDDGFATLKLSFKLGKEDFTYAVNLLESELSYYVATVLGVVDEVVEAVEEAKVEEIVEAVPEVLSSVITCFGYEVQISAEGNTIVFTYPSFITNAEVAAAAKAAYNAYSQYFDGSTLYIDSAAGTAVLTLAYDLTEADFDYAVALLQDELTSYVASLVTEEVAEEVVDVVTEVAEAISEVLSTETEEAPAEEPAVEEPATEAPAEEPAKEETKEEAPAEEPAKEETKEEAPATQPAKEETKTEAPATQPAKEETKTEAPATQPAATATAEPAKKSNAGLVVLIIVLVAVAAAAVVLFLKKKKN